MKEFIIPILLGIGFVLGYAWGYGDGSPIVETNEIIWVEPHEPLVMSAFSLECRLIPKDEE